MDINRVNANGRLPDEAKEAPRIYRILNVRMSIQVIYFIKTRRVVPTAGLDKESGLWFAALLHFETHKIIIHTKPFFKTKKQALAFGDELVYEARRTKIS